MRSPPFLCPLLLLTLLVSGCAIHAPMSEMVMYSSSKPPQGIIAGLGATYTIIPVNWEAIRQEAEWRYTTEPTIRVEPFNLRKQGFALQALWYLQNRTAAFSVSSLSMLGADVTIKMPRELYLTAVGSLWGGYEFILQRSFFEHRYGGVAAGVSFRQEVHSFFVEDVRYPSENWWAGPDREFTDTTFGIRAAGLLSELSKPSLFLRPVVFIGYSALLKTPVVRVSISGGAF